MPDAPAVADAPDSAQLTASSLHSEVYGFEEPLVAPKAHRKPRLVYPTKVLEARAAARAARTKAKAAELAEAKQWQAEMERVHASAMAQQASHSWADASAAATRGRAKSMRRKHDRGRSTQVRALPVQYLSDGWVELVHPESETAYFHNTLTGETTWSRPDEGSVQQTEQQTAQQTEQLPEQLPKQLPDGWSEHVDPESGALFFHNASTGETTWNRPAGNAKSAASEELGVVRE